MKIKIKTFANLKTICDFEEKTIKIPKNSLVENILNSLIIDFPSLKAEKDYLLFAINDEYADLQTELKNNDTLAIFPAVSGG